MPSFIDDPYISKLPQDILAIQKEKKPSIGFVGHAQSGLLKYFKELVTMQGWHESNELPSDDLWKGSATVALRKIRHGLGKLAEAEKLKIN